MRPEGAVVIGPDGDPARAVRPLPRHLLVFLVLLGREHRAQHLGDAHAHLLAHIRRHRRHAGRPGALDGGELGVERGLDLAHLVLAELELGLQLLQQPRPALADGSQHRAGRPAIARQRGLRGPARLEAQRLARHHDHVLLLAGDDLDIGRHAGQETAQRIVGVDHHRVGDDIIERDRREPDLLDLALERHVGIGIDGEADRVVSRHLADIRLIDLRLDLHMGEVLSDGEQLRRRHAGGDGLARFHRALDHHAVDRRADIGALEIDARGVERRLALLERRLGVLDLRLGDGEVGGGGLLRGGRRIEIGLRADALLDQLRGAGEVELGLMQIGLGALRPSPLAARHWPWRWPAPLPPRAPWWRRSTARCGQAPRPFFTSEEKSA